MDGLHGHLVAVAVVEVQAHPDTALTCSFEGEVRQRLDARVADLQGSYLEDDGPVVVLGGFYHHLGGFQVPDLEGPHGAAFIPGLDQERLHI